MDKVQVKKERDIIVSQLREYSAPLRPFFELEMKMKEYPRKIYDFEIKPEHEKRQVVVRDKIYTKFEQLFGSNCKEDLNLDLNGSLAFNIADHHQVLNHPILISSNVISGADTFFQEQKQKETVVI